MNKLIETYGDFENEKVKLKQDFIFSLKSNSAKVKLSKNQYKLLFCLLAQVNSKNEITARLWGNKMVKSENRINQLVFKFRKSLVKAGFPDDTILTIHRYGLCLNKNLLATKDSLSSI